MIFRMVSWAALCSVYPGLVPGHVGISHRIPGLATNFVFQPQKFLQGRDSDHHDIANYPPDGHMVLLESTSKVCAGQDQSPTCLCISRWHSAARSF